MLFPSHDPMFQRKINGIEVEHQDYKYVLVVRKNNGTEKYISNKSYILTVSTTSQIKQAKIFDTYEEAKEYGDGLSEPCKEKLKFYDYKIEGIYYEYTLMGGVNNEYRAKRGWFKNNKWY